LSQIQTARWLHGLELGNDEEANANEISKASKKDKKNCEVS